MRALALVLVLVPALASAQDAPRPAHPAVRYSCMSDPPPGQGWPWVAAGVPHAIEILHPGYGIQRWSGFTVPGLALFLIEGGPRREGLSERYAYVEAVDEAGAVLSQRALFVRAAAGVSSAYDLAHRAMAILLRRADERPLQSAPTDISEHVRDRIAAPAVEGRTLTFWLRNRADMPYASLITVDLDTGIASGDPG